MELKCKLVKKTFKDDEGNSRDYYVLEFTLVDGSTLDISLKSDKAKILLMSNNLANTSVDKDIWEEQ